MLNVSFCFRDNHVQVVVVDQFGFMSTSAFNALDDAIEYVSDIFYEFERKV